MSNIKLLYFGFLTPIMFWGTILLCGLMTQNYNHLTNLVSELGANGTRTQYFFTTGLVICALFSILFIIGLFKTANELKINTLPIITLLAFSISVLGAGIFALPNKLHGILGSPSMILPLSPLLAFFLWKSKIIQDIKFSSLIFFLIMLLGFLILIPIMNNFIGLKQRFFHIGWTLWFLYLSKRFLELNKNERQCH